MRVVGGAGAVCARVCLTDAGLHDVFNRVHDSVITPAVAVSGAPMVRLERSTWNVVVGSPLVIMSANCWSVGTWMTHSSPSATRS